MTAYERPTDSLPISRRTVIMNTGLAAAAIAGLSSCTVYGSAPVTEPTPAGSGEASGGTGGSQGLTVKTADIPVGSGKVFPDAQTVITQPKAKEFKAFSSICTHQGCQVDAVTTTINCPCHGSRYAITDGSVVQGPARTGLRVEQVAVDGDHVVLL